MSDHTKEQSCFFYVPIILMWVKGKKRSRFSLRRPRSCFFYVPIILMWVKGKKRSRFSLRRPRLKRVYMGHSLSYPDNLLVLP